ncbi:MAG TPA: hypothetical protein VFQ45_19135 [Longimicrobium sp.]|nr:hypothetical protein [Longimicrobium sp.]
MKRYAALALLLLAAACSDVRDQPLTARTVAELKGADQLNAEERGLLVSYMLRATLGTTGLLGGDTKGAKLDGSVTIGEAIEAQRKFVRDDSIRAANEKKAEEQRLARRNAQLAEMRRAVTAAVVGKGFQAADTRNFQFQDYITFRLEVANNGSKPISGIKGGFVFRDQFDDEIISIGYKHDETLAPGAKATVNKVYDYNQYMDDHRKLRETPLDKLKVTWEPETVIFTDGTRLELPKDTASTRSIF